MGVFLMRADIVNVFKVASVYVGIILGAGFASGQEIVKFFVNYGYMGLFGLLLSGVVFSLVGWAVMDICVKNNIKSYSSFVDLTLGKHFGRAMDILVMIFLMVLFCTMLAAAGAAMQQVFNFHYTVSVILIAILCFIALLFDVKGFVKINILLVPILVVGGIFIGLYSFFNGFSLDFISGEKSIGWVRGALLYASYNIITAVTVLCTLNELGMNKHVAKWGSIFSGVVMTLLGFSLSLALYSNVSAIHTEIPVLSIVSNYGSTIQILYFVILMVAIFTTAIANGFALSNYFIDKTRVKSIFVKAAIVFAGIIFAHIGFSNFVGTVYPIFGYIGFFEIIFIILFALAYRHK